MPTEERTKSIGRTKSILMAHAATMKMMLIEKQSSKKIELTRMMLGRAIDMLMQARKTQKRTSSRTRRAPTKAQAGALKKRLPATYRTAQPALQQN